MKNISIPQDLYDRMVCWMADHEDPELLMESQNMGWAEVDAYLNEEVFDIIYKLKNLCDFLE